MGLGMYPVRTGREQKGWGLESCPPDFLRGAQPSLCFPVASALRCPAAGLGCGGASGVSSQSVLVGSDTCSSQHSE